MNDGILWRYAGAGMYIDGVPARDLTAADWEGLDAFQRSAVEHGGLYRPKWTRAAVEKPVAAESPEEPVEKAAEDGPRKGKRGQEKE